ncbi:MAG: hypothetical protein CL528_10910 [Aequorivita sp.]|nr:hypothetical protein [Aequorivita sp.]MBP42275.1 hypothetical protein [Aequorivita sp.]|tara:strand:- start:1465 stop:2364 length:900 start_codon:yes stop_codon:yes gene_type:complete
MTHTFHIVVFLLCIVSSFAQQQTDTVPRLYLVQIAHINQSDSYITFPTDVGNIEPLMFEANLNPNFVVRKRADSRMMMVLTPQITIRMFNEESYPVKTPSYIPQLSLYYLFGYPKLAHHTTMFARIAHHSNGQDGNFYNSDTSINLQSGNFATNFLEIGFIDTSYGSQVNAVKFFKSSLEIHPKSWMLDELKGQYSGLRWHNSFFAYKLPLDRDFFSKERKANFSLKIETTWMFDEINDWKIFDTKRFSGAFTFYYHPKFLEDIGFFIKFYHGLDYYNIYFQHQLDIIRFGLMTEILRF